jgi:hypothetical protein
MTVMSLTVDPKLMTLADLLLMFNLSPAGDQYEKPLDARHVGVLEFVRTDYDSEERARVRLSYRYDANVDIEISLVDAGALVMLGVCGR